MKILILGGDGMIGSQMRHYFQKEHTVKITVRKSEAYFQNRNFEVNDCYFDVDVTTLNGVAEILGEFRPNAVINATGIVKQRKTAKEIIPTLTINALAPHQLANLCALVGSKMIQLSTDCIFSGEKGNYTESDLSDATDIYGKTKFLGEVHHPSCITLRTSTIGLELGSQKGLIEWFLAQTGNIRGFNNAIYTGVITVELARIIEKLLLNFPDLSGLWHVAGDKINKYDLLQSLEVKLGRNDIFIEKDPSFLCDRSLDASRFNQKVGYTPPSWDAMLEELALQIKARQSTVVA